MCTVLHAIVAAALSRLAGSSAPAALLGRGLERGGDRCWFGCIFVGAGGWGFPIARGRGPPADAFFERSRLLCRHRAPPFLGASKPDLSEGPQWAHLIDGQERNSQTRACIVHHVHLSLRHRHRRAFPPRRFISARPAAVQSGDRAGLGSVDLAHGTRRARAFCRIVHARQRGVQLSLQLSGWSLRSRVRAKLPRPV
jgi:hypothetical protein